MTTLQLQSDRKTWSNTLAQTDRHTQTSDICENVKTYILAESLRLSADGLKYVLLCSTARWRHLPSYFFIIPSHTTATWQLPTLHWSAHLTFALFEDQITIPVRHIKCLGRRQWQWLVTYYLKSMQTVMQFATITYLYVVWQMHVCVLQDQQGHCNVSIWANCPNPTRIPGLEILQSWIRGLEKWSRIANCNA